LNIAVASDEGRARENTKNGRIRAKNQGIGGKIERKRVKLQCLEAPKMGFCFWENSAYN